MTETAPERDEDRFEEVLGRLDALVRRGQPNEDPPPPAIENAAIPVLTEVLVSGPAEVSDTIPLLTDTLNLERNHAHELILPHLVKVVEDVLAQQIQPVLEEALRSRVAELRPQIETLLRQHLQQALAQEKNQIEE